MARNKNDKSQGKSQEGKAVAKKASVNPFQYLSQVRQEARKVTWTSRQETLVSTVMVLIMSLIAMAFFWVVDFSINATVRFLLSLSANV